MTREEAKIDLQVLIDYFNEEYGATPLCLEYCMNMLNEEEEDDTV